MIVDFLVQMLGPIVTGMQGMLDFIWPSAGEYGVDANLVLGFTIPFLGLIPLVLIAAPLERLRPIENHDSPEARATIRTEWMLIASMATMVIVLQIVQFIVLGRAVMAMGGPLLYLKAQSVLGSIGLVIVYALYIDCAEYWFHRISHKVPFIWAVHSFHHSAERLTIVTGARHHWTEAVVLAPLLFVTVILFQVPEHIMTLSLLLRKVPNGMQHLNYNIPWHRVGIWCNTPWWHRIHHSVEPAHLDKNFSVAFPIMDVIFGTAYYPAPNEYPKTGLTPRKNPRVWEGIIWPFPTWFGYRRES